MRWRRAAEVEPAFSVTPRREPIRLTSTVNDSAPANRGTISMNDLIQQTDYLPVFEHVKRRDWGLGILAWERQGTRGYLFENGQLRIMAAEFYSFMREVDRPRDEVVALYECLNRE